jgi:PAS domain-containing protein
VGVLGIGLLWRRRRSETSEGALRASEERYALAMEGANEGHWDWDLKTDRLFVSATMAMLQGHRPEHVTTTRTAWLAQIELHPDDWRRFEIALRDHLEGRTPSFECEYRVRDGDWRWLLARAGVRMRPVNRIASPDRPSTSRPEAGAIGPRTIGCNFARRRRWRQWVLWPAARTISTTSSAQSWATASRAAIVHARHPARRYRNAARVSAPRCSSIILGFSQRPG